MTKFFKNRPPSRKKNPGTPLIQIEEDGFQVMLTSVAPGFVMIKF